MISAMAKLLDEGNHHRWNVAKGLSDSA